MPELIFCKLGGSVLTDKTRPEAARTAVIARLAREVAGALSARPGLRLVLGHGSGSFGHFAARRYGTQAGVHSPAEWVGFAEVASAAARLNRIVAGALWQAGVPAWSLPPSASARCHAGELLSLATFPVEAALDHGLVPLVYGDVALDDQLGGTIVSTEQVLAYLAGVLHPDHLVLVSEVDGVFLADPHEDPSALPVPEITPGSWSSLRDCLGAAHGTDVTGGMRSKVEAMLRLVEALPGLRVHILSGLREGALEERLRNPSGAQGGTLILA